MNRRGFMKFLGALGFAPKIAPDLQAFDLPRCPRCKGHKTVCVVTYGSDEWLGSYKSYTAIDCPRCETKKYLECMQDFSADQWLQIHRQLWPEGKVKD